MPLLLKSFEFFLGPQTKFAIPLPLLLIQSILMLVIPVLCGILLRHKYPQLVEKHAAVLRKVSFLALAALILFIIYQARDSFIRDLGAILVASGSLIFLSFSTGYLLGLLFRFEASDRFTLAIEYAVRNVAIATAVAVTILKRPEFAVFGTAYFLTEVPIILLTIAFYRKLRYRPVPF
jgi:BASS family bile acid:Na+ symporter